MPQAPSPKPNALWAAINRPNAMIKIPATDAGLEALSALVASGININLTLLFSRQQTLKAYAAYTAGLTQLAANGGNCCPSASGCQLFHLPALTAH